MASKSALKDVTHNLAAVHINSNAASSVHAAMQKHDAAGAKYKTVF